MQLQQTTGPGVGGSPHLQSSSLKLHVGAASARPLLPGLVCRTVAVEEISGQGLVLSLVWVGGWLISQHQYNHKTFV